MSYAVDEAGREWQYDEAGSWYCYETGETMGDFEFRMKNPQIGAVERYRSALGRSGGNDYVPASGASYKQRIDTMGHYNIGKTMATNFVKYGLWTDYNRYAINRYQILLNDRWAGILTNTVAILITSVGGPMFMLTIGPYNWLSRKISSRRTNIQSAALEDAHDLQERIDIVLQNLPNGGFVHIPLGGAPVPRRKREAIEVIGAAAMVLIIIGLPIMLITASILSAGLATDTTALSNFGKCGRYASVETNSSTASLEYEHKAEAEANLYATDCYGSSPLINNCNRFYNQSIGYTVSKVECLFKGNVCDTPQNGSIQLSTGLVSGSVLGINSKNPYYFSRTMTCSPLVGGDEYVGIGLSEQGEKQWEYWYGSSLSNYTSANPVQESPWEIKGYSTSVHWSDPMAARSPYQPLDEFTAGPYPVTLTFISSHTLFYPTIRNDVVFPAHTKAQFLGGYKGPDLYYNNSTRAGVLGCVDQYQICESLNGRCWDNSNITLLLNEQSTKGHPKSQYVTWLILIALKYSTSAGSTQFRGSEGLDAQAKIAHMLSLPLAEQQWQVEAEKMFRTSLARMQLNLYDFVRGTAASYEGYQNTLPVEHRAMCQMIEIPTVGWRNINLLGLLGTVFAVGFVWGILKQKDANGNEVFVVVSTCRWIATSTVLMWQGMLVPGVKALGLIAVGILKYLRRLLLALVS